MEALLKIRSPPELLESTVVALKQDLLYSQDAEKNMQAKGGTLRACRNRRLLRAWQCSPM
jgi:hypothetical protein